MAKAQFVHVGFNWVKAPKTTEIEPIFNKALDWARYSPNCWILYTSTAPRTWYERVKPHLGPGDHVFVCKLDISERGGWLPKWIWEWLTKQR